MYKLIRIINQNRKQILIAILAIVFVIVIIQVLNIVAKNSNKEKLENLKQESTKINTSTYNPSHAVISGTTINENANENASKLINEFISNCNDGKIENAYNLLSTDCKEQVYPNLESFKIYYEENFKTKKDYSIQLWTSSTLTYKVELYEDVLSTGKVQEGSVIQDFFTVVKENGQRKLNISEYIKKVQIGKSVTKNEITITANYKNIYKDYEIYNITIENKTKNTILLDSKESSKTMYLKGTTGAQYTAYTYEIPSTNLILNSYYKRNLNIKYNKQYTTNSNIKSIVFSDVVLNNDEYKQIKNKKEYRDRITIELDI